MTRGNLLHSRRRLVTLVMLCQLATACAIGTTSMNINRAPLQSDSSPRTGNLLVEPFIDARAEDRRPYVGAKRNGFGMVLGHVALPEGQTLEAILTGYFVEALQASGYQAAVADAEGRAPKAFDPDAVISGEIRKFWLDMYMATWHNIEIGVALSDLSDQLLWETVIRGEETNVLWLGITPEFEGVIHQALDKALAQAVEEFSSDDFQAQVQLATDHGGGETTTAREGMAVDATSAGPDPFGQVTP